MVESHQIDSMKPNWHDEDAYLHSVKHLRRRPETVEQISGFKDLKTENQLREESWIFEHTGVEKKNSKTEISKLSEEKGATGPDGTFLPFPIYDGETEPKLNKVAFTLFCKSIRKKLKKTLPLEERERKDVLHKALTKCWSELNTEEKKHWEIMEIWDKRRFVRDNALYRRKKADVVAKQSSELWKIQDSTTFHSAPVKAAQSRRCIDFPKDCSISTSQSKYLSKKRKTTSVSKKKTSRRKATTTTIEEKSKSQGTSQLIINKDNLPIKEKKRTWDESFEVLERYKEINGNCNVPSKYPKDRALGQWVEKVRRGAVGISSEKREKLDGIGFDWETLEQKNIRDWNEKYKRLKQYKTLFGDTRIPNSVSSRTPDDKVSFIKELGPWVSRQRQFYKRKRLRESQLDKLQEIGFEWSLVKVKEDRDTSEKDRVWYQNYQKLTAFYKENGHCMVTLSYDDRSLFMWVKNQREFNKRNILTAKRRELLDGINFNFYCDPTNPQASHNQRQWNKMFQELLDFQQLHRHLNVPAKKSALGNWLEHQCIYWRKNELPEWRAQRLEEIGIDKDLKYRNKK